jgi:hypothetical protein
MEVIEQLRALVASTLEKEPIILTGEGLSEPQSQSDHCGEQKNLLLLPGFKLWPSSL